MTDLRDFISQALKEFDLEEMPMAGDPLRPRIAQRVFDLAISWFEESRNLTREAPTVTQSRLGVPNGK